MTTAKAFRGSLWMGLLLAGSLCDACGAGAAGSGRVGGPPDAAASGGSTG